MLEVRVSGPAPDGLNKNLEPIPNAQLVLGSKLIMGADTTFARLKVESSRSGPRLNSKILVSFSKISCACMDWGKKLNVRISSTLGTFV